MTSLIDVIFLLLLFFMLSSTFSKFSEIELTAGGSAPGGAAETPPLFLRLGQDDLSLNGQTTSLGALQTALGQSGPASVADDRPRTVLVSLGQDVTAQRLTDLLGALRGTEGISPLILGGSSE